MKAFLLIAGLVVLMCVAGTCDYAEQVVYNMPEKTYNDIKEKLGDDATTYDIAREFKKNRDKYE